MEVRGEAIKITDCTNHVPIGLMNKVQLKRNIEEGEIITFDDINIPDSLALEAWKSTLSDVAVKNRLSIKVSC